MFLAKASCNSVEFTVNSPFEFVVVDNIKFPSSVFNITSESLNELFNCTVAVISFHPELQLLPSHELPPFIFSHSSSIHHDVLSNNNDDKAILRIVFFESFIHNLFNISSFY